MLSDVELMGESSACEFCGSYPASWMHVGNVPMCTNSSELAVKTLAQQSERRRRKETERNHNAHLMFRKRPRGHLGGGLIARQLACHPSELCSLIGRLDVVPGRL